MPKLLQISLSVTNRSVGGIAKQIGQRAIANGWESYITYTHQTELSECDSRLIRVSSKFDFYLHALLTRCFDLHGLGSYFATKALVKQIKRIHPDVIQLHNLHGYYLNYKVLFDFLNQKTNVPVVWTFHDCWSFTGHCSHFVEANCEKWKTGCNSCQLTREYPKSYFDNSRYNYQKKKEAFSSNKNLHIVTVSQWLFDYVKQSFLGEKDVRVIHNGIDISKFKYKKKSKDRNKGKFIILGVSSVWNKSKGLYDFYELRKQLSDDYHIVLIGLTLEQIEKLPKGIEGHTRTSNVSELADYYTHADIFVNPTYADSFPTVNLEALACGIPVVTYRTGGSPEAVDEKTGIVVEQGDVEGLLNSIERIKESDNLYNGDLCRKRAEECFDKNNCYQQYINIYNELLNA